MERLPLETERASTHDFATTLAKLKAAGEARNFPVVTELDIQARIVGKGMECEPTVVLGFCNSPLAKKILDDDIRVVSQLPCRSAVVERGGAVTVSAMDAMALPLLYSGQHVQEVAEAVAKLVEEVMAEACG